MPTEYRQGVAPREVGKVKKEDALVTAPKPKKKPKAKNKARTVEKD